MTTPQVSSVKAARLRNNITPSRVARQAEIRVSTLFKVEDGEIFVTPQIFRRIHDAIDFLAAEDRKVPVDSEAG